jgi:hypothetical protein
MSGTSIKTKIVIESPFGKPTLKGTPFENSVEPPLIIIIII